MADRIKGITVEIGGDVTKLNDSLRSVNREINGTQSALKDVERLLKMDPKNTELLAQKQQLLTQAIESTEKKLEALKEAEKQAQEQFERGEISQQQYQGLQREIAATEQSLKQLKAAAEDSKTTLEKVGDAAGTVAEKTKGLSTAAAAGAAGLAGLAVKAGMAADDLNTLAKQSGFGTDEIQKWQYAADRVDVSVDDIVGAAKKMKKNMVSTSADVTAAWDQLGVSVRDNNGELRDSTEVFYEVLTALSQVENETERDILAMQLFGKSADSLAGIVDDGGATLREFGDEAKAAGLILSQDALDGANAFNDGLDTIKAKATAAAMSAGASLAENLLPVLDGLVEKLSGVLEWVAQLDGGQLQLLAGILLVVAAISPGAKIIQGISGAVGAVMTILPKLSAAITAIIGPVGIAVAAIAGVIAVLVLLWNKCDGFREAVTAAWEVIKAAFQGFMDWLQATFAPVWEAVVAAAQTIFQGFKDALAAAWEGITAVFQIFADFLQEVFGVTWSNVFAKIQGIMDALGPAIQAVIQFITQIFTGLVTFLAGEFVTRFKTAIQTVVEFLTAFKDNVIQIIDGVKMVIHGIIDFIVGVFTGDWKKAWQGVQNIFKGIFEALVGIAKAPINGIISMINVAIDAINVFIRGINKALSILSIFDTSAPQIPELSHIAYLAKGGILEAGNAIVGENGPELLSMVNGRARVTPLENSGGESDTATTAAAVGGYNQTLNFYAQAMTPSEVARQTRNATRKMIARARA